MVEALHVALVILAAGLILVGFRVVQLGLFLGQARARIEALEARCRPPHKPTAREIRALGEPDFMQRIEQLMREAEHHLGRGYHEIEQRLSACEAEVKALKQQQSPPPPPKKT